MTTVSIVGHREIDGAYIDKVMIGGWLAYAVDRS